MKKTDIIVDKHRGQAIVILEAFIQSDIFILLV